MELTHSGQEVMNPDGPAWVEELRSLRKGQWIGGNIHFFSEVDSTNTRAREWALKGGGEGLVILADAQSRGKGRLGRRWESPPGVNLYASVLLRPPIPAVEAPQITTLAGVAAARALAHVSGLDARIKWPNDIVIHGRKVAGILAEMEMEGDRTRFVILGIGVNVNWEEAPPDLKGTATSLRIEAGKEFPRTLVADAIFAELGNAYALFLREGLSPGLQEAWNQRSWVNEKRVTALWEGQKMEGRVLGLDRDGALLLRDDEGQIRRLIAGEISLRM